MKIFYLKVSAIIVIFFAFICFGLFINNTDLNLVAYAETEPTAQGSCGESANWYYYEELGTLHITGNGEISSYSGWSSYRSNIKNIIVDNSITTIKQGVFKGCNKLKEISLPFVGESRSATGLNATFGYIFDYTTTNGYVDGATYSKIYNQSTLYGLEAKSGSGGFYCKLLFDGATDTENGVIAYYIPASSSSYSFPTTTNSRGAYNKSRADYDFVDYHIDTIAGTTWQYTCYDYQKSGDSWYYLQSYYYYIPSSLTKVSITNANKISDAAFMNCTNITELNLNDGIVSIGNCAFRNLGYLNDSTEEYVVTGDILLAYKGTSENVDIPEGINIIAERAFYGNKTITAVNIPESVTVIGDYAFYNCYKARIYVPKISGVLTANTNAFTFVKQVIYLDKSSYTNGNDTFYFTVDESGNASVVGCSTTSTNITLPVSLGEYLVTTIGYRGMANCTTLSAITIPNNITSLGAYAFAGCTGLDVVTVPATCTYIGTHAFSGCSAMTTTIIAEGVLYIGDYAFENCTSLSEIVVPDTCEYLGKYAFYNCVSMQSASVGNSTPAILEYAFYNCESLTTIVVGINVVSVGDYSFYNTALSTLYLHQLPNLKTIGDYAFASCDNITTVRLRAIEKIGDGAFFNDALISQINLPNTLNDIGEYAFYGCTSLISITIPSFVTNIKDYSFAYAGLETITINGILSYIGEKAFYNNNLSAFVFKEGVTSIGSDAFAFNDLTEVILPDTLTDIGQRAFNECRLLVKVSMPDSVYHVGTYAFSANAKDLAITVRCHTGKIADYMLFNTDASSVIMEDGIMEIGNYSFACNRKLENIIFPNTLQTIGNYSFYNNLAYSELMLPNTVTSIGDYAFAHGYRFVKIIIPDNIHTIGSYAFYQEESTNHVNPEFTVEIYYCNGIIVDNLLYQQHIQHVIVDDYIHTIGNNAFSNCLNLLSIILPDTIANVGTNCFGKDKDIVMNIKSVDGLIDENIYHSKLSGVGIINIENSDIGAYAFYDNQTVLDVNILGESVIGNYSFAENKKLQTLNIFGNGEIGAYAFSNNISLTDTYLTGTSNIGEYAFYNCNSMTSFIINGTIQRIGEHAFDSCKSLGSMILPNTVNYIGSYAFYDCNSMPSINIPYGITRIKSHAFYGCAALQNIETPNSVLVIEDYAFYGCVLAKNIIISNKCTEIGEAAFYNCKAVEELIIPDSVKSIGDYAFRSCVEITELDFSDNIETMGASAFYDCNALETVHLGRKIIELKNNLFYGCVNLKSLYVYAPLSYIDETAFFGAYEVTVYCARDDYMISFFEENFIDYVILDGLIYEYKVVFQMDDKEIISSAIYEYGATVNVPENPTKAADNTYTYAFTGWDQELTIVGGNKIYTAIFTPTYIEYTIIFKNYDGTVLSATTYHYGDTVNIPATPIKPLDNTYTYAFKSWDKEVVNCSGNATYTATYDSNYIDYTVTFKNYDGIVLSTANYHYGDAVIEPAIPSKPADNTYTYAFKSWDKEVVNCIADAIYTATYNSTYIDYTVVFKNYDDTVLSTKTYHYGESVIVPETPTKPANNTYTYSFKSWDKTVVNCAGNATYTATYNENYIEYTVTFKNYDGTVLSSRTYHYGGNVIVPSTPTKPSDNTYSYSFNGWDKTVVNCVGDATYTATYSPNYIDYVVTFKNYNGDIISESTYHYGSIVNVPSNPTMPANEVGTFVFTGWDKEITACDGNKIYTANYDIEYIDYTVIFKNYDNTVLSTKTYHYGDSIVVPATPTKTADNTYTYSFKSWDKEVVNCAGNATYTATYDSNYIDYTVTFKNYDGTVLSSTTYHYGDAVNTSATPTKSADNTYTYTFKSWDKEVVNVVGDAIYTATYDATYIDYTIVFKNYDGTVLSSTTYHYGDDVIKPATPSKPADNTYTYSFKSWDKEIVNCIADATYTATYNSTYIDYTVIFKNYDNTVLSTKTYHYGESVIVPETPSKPADNTYTYGFSGWDSEVVACNGNKTYIAQFTPTYIEYTVIFKNYNDVILSSTKYHYGDSIVIPATPSKPADNTCTYSFKSWDKEVVNCVGDAIYTATFNETYIEYTVTFLNWDSSEIQKVSYHYGETIISIPNPERENDETYTYEFTSWNKPLGVCSGNTKFTAQYEATYINYTIIFKDQNDVILSRKNDYHYGDNVIKPNNPEKESNNVYTYTFKGWKDFSSVCIGNATYVPEFNEEYINYSVIFKDYNGTVLSENTYHYGDTIVVPSNPTRSSDTQYSYTFNGWDKEISETCIGDAEYTATYTQSKVENVVPSQDGGSGCSGNVSAGDSAGNIIMSAGTLSIFFAIIIIRKKKRYNT